MAVTGGNIEFAIGVAVNERGINLGLGRCDIAKLVLTFLRELQGQSGFIVKLVLGYVLKKLEEKMKEWGC